MTRRFPLWSRTALAATSLAASCLMGAAPAWAQTGVLDVGVSATVENPFQTFDIDGDGRHDMLVSVTWDFDSRSGNISDNGYIAFLGAYQGELAITGDGYLNKFDAGHTITAADFATDRRNDGAHLWIASWASDTPGTGYNPDSFMDFPMSYPYDSPVTAQPVERLYSSGLWQEQGDQGYAVFRQVVNGDYRYGWVHLTHGSVDVGQLGFGTQVAAAAVPEPGTLAMMLGGFAVLAGAARRRRASDKA